MIDIPSPVTGRTRPSAQGLGYLSPAAGRPSAFGAGAAEALGRLGVNLQAARDRADAQAKSTQRFDVMRSLEQFQTKIAEDMVNLKRQADPADANFFDQASSVYANAEGEWLNSIPEEFRDEFAARTAQLGSTVLKDALTFQFESTDNYYRTGLTQELNKSLTVLENGGDLEAEQKRISELVGATALSDIEKDALLRTYRGGLQAIGYRKEAERMFMDRIDLATNPSSMALIADEEGISYKAYPDTRTSTGEFDAWRIGHGSDTVTRADGTVERVTKDTVATDADIKRDLRRRVAEEEAQLFKELGTDWERLDANARSGITSVAYNYGTLPDSVKQVIRSGGGNEEIAQAVERLSANTERRKREAAIIRGQPGGISSRLDNDPRYADVPYEDRVALQSDAQTKAASVVAQRQAAATAAAEQRLNELLIGINDGTKGQYDLDQWRLEEGENLDYDHLKKAQDLLDSKMGDTMLALEGADMLARGEVFDPTNTDHKKRLNAVVGDSGIASLQAMDPTYVTDALVPIVRGAKDIPTDVAGILEGMTRSDNNSMAEFAFATLQQLQEASEPAYISRIPDRVRQDVEYWRTMKSYTPGADIMSGIRGGNSQEERVIREGLKKQGEEFLKTSEGIKLIDSAFKETTPDWWEPSPQNIPWAAARLQTEFRNLFVVEFSRTGNVDKAKQTVINTLRQKWGTTDIGNTTVFMRLPPHFAGYKPMNGSFDWIERQVRDQFGMERDENFQLISDTQTEAELQAWQLNPDAEPPSYVIVRTDANGVPRELPERMNFKPGELDLASEETNRMRERLTIERDTKLREAMALSGGLTLPPQELLDEIAALEKEIEELGAPVFNEDNPINQVPVN